MLDCLKTAETIFIISRPSPWIIPRGCVRKMTVSALVAKTRNVSFLETCFVGETDFHCCSVFGDQQWCAEREPIVCKVMLSMSVVSAKVYSVSLWRFVLVLSTCVL
jgi:hypothetical protein